MDHFSLRADSVRARIRELDLKHYWVAEVAGVHKSTLRRWLTGRINRVRAENVQRLARVLETTDAHIADAAPEGRSARSRKDEAGCVP